MVRDASLRWSIRLALTLALLCLLGGCISSIQAATGISAYCSPPSASHGGWTEDQVGATASRAERIAALLGVSDELDHVRHLPASESQAARLLILERLDFARTTIEATVAELDCEGERAEQLSTYLEQKEERSTMRLTVASITVGAATGIVSAFLSTADTSTAVQGTVAVVGGTATGALALVPLGQSPKVEFRHERNMLTDIWEGPPESTAFSDLVWAYLSRAEFSNQQVESIRARIVSRWLEFRTLAQESSESPLLFGAGGWYDAETLRRRAAMLDQVKAEVRLMNQDLAELSYALNAAVAEDTSPSP
jgi:hypothetical protein